MPITHAADVAKLLDELGIRDAVLIGCSLGGRVALELAVARPDLVSALVLVGAATQEALAVAPEIHTYQHELMKAIEQRDLEAAVEVNLRTWVDGPHRTPHQVDGKLRASIATMQRDALLNTRDVAASWREESMVTNLSTKLDRIAVPTLVIVGELDMDFIHEQGHLFASRIRHSRLHTLASAAHAPTAEQPDAFNDLALRFVATTVSPGGT
jgi:pimeloyl-ACP methyl ester carboxylesterase